MICWAAALVFLLLALCLQNVKSFRNLYIGISCRGEVFRHCLAGSMLLCWQEYGICSCNSIRVKLQCPSSLRNPACLEVSGFWLVCELLGRIFKGSGYRFMFHVTLLKSCKFLLCILCCLSTTLKWQSRLLLLCVQNECRAFLTYLPLVFFFWRILLSQPSFFDLNPGKLPIQH